MVGGESQYQDPGPLGLQWSAESILPVELQDSLQKKKKNFEKDLEVKCKRSQVISGGLDQLKHRWELDDMQHSENLGKARQVELRLDQ